MADEKILEEDKPKVGFENKRFDFMTNIFTPSHDRTTYIKFLEKYTMDGQVTYMRLILFLLIVSPLVFGAIYVLLNDFDRLRYIVLPIILFIAAVIIYGINFLINSRGESMLTTLLKLNIFKNYEKIRRKSKGNYHGYFVKDIADTGVITLQNGHVAMLYEIEGSLSASTLPQVVNSIHEAKRQHLVGRTAEGMETQILQIKQIDLDKIIYNMEQLKKNCIKNEKLTKDEKNWIAYMSNAHVNFMEKYHKGKEYKMNQYLLLSDIDDKELEISIRNLTSSANNGLYSQIRWVNKKDEIVRVLSSMTLKSKRGLNESIKFIEKEQERQQLTRNE